MLDTARCGQHSGQNTACAFLSFQTSSKQVLLQQANKRKITIEKWAKWERSVYNKHIRSRRRGFPSGTMVQNPPANAGDTGSSPGPGRSHMPRSNWVRAPQLLSLRSRVCELQLLSPRATTTEARAPRARAPQQEKPPQWEARAPQPRVAPARRN